MPQVVRQDNQPSEGLQSLARRSSRRAREAGANTVNTAGAAAPEMENIALVYEELALRYGTNPQQTPARVSRAGGLPFVVRSGAPGYINLLDALNAWQLVREMRGALGLPAAASFKHVSPAGAAVAVPLDAAATQAYFVDDLELSPLATAYARARGADRLSSFGDFVAVSDPVDVPTATLLSREVSDGIIAPGFHPDALAILQKKQKGKYIALEMDPEYAPGDTETREVFGITFTQRRNDLPLTLALLDNVVTARDTLPNDARRNLLVALIALKYTQSNSVCLARDGQVIGMGAGQQSRVHCARLAASKADRWWLRQHPAVLGLPFRADLKRPERENAIDAFLEEELSAEEERALAGAFATPPARLTREGKRAWLDTLRGVSLGSDGFIPFRDTIDRASRSGVEFVAQPGGSLRDDAVIAACDTYSMAMAMTGARLFHH